MTIWYANDFVWRSSTTNFLRKGKEIVRRVREVWRVEAEYGAYMEGWDYSVCSGTVST